MVAILEKGEFNSDYHPMVDFITASPLRTVSESSLRRNLKLRDEGGIVSIPDTELFENLKLMGTYNFSKMIFAGMVKNVFNKISKFLMYPRFLTICLGMIQFGQITHTHQYVVPFHTKKLFTTLRVNSPSFSGRIVPLFDTMLVHQGKGSGTLTEPHHTPFPAADTSHPTTSSILLSSIPTTPIPPIAQPEPTPIRKYSRRARIAQSSALPTVADEPASPVRDVSEGEACPTESGFIGRSINEGEAAAERISNDSEDIARVLTSMDAATVLAGEIDVPTSSGSILTAGPPATVISIGSEVGPTASLIVTRRKGKEVMVESNTLKKKKLQEQIDAQVARELEEQQEKEDMRMNEQIARDAEVARIHAEEELKGMIDSLDKSNETIAKYLQEYHDFASELPLEKRIELISDLVKYQDNYSKVYKFQSQQRRPMTKKKKRESYMAMIKNNLGWKVKDFKGMTFEEIEAKFAEVWKQVEDFIPIGSNEETERLKRKGLNLEQEQVNKQKSSEEALEIETSTKEFTKEKMKEMMQLVPVEDVYVQAL
nr:hypothetical protein [Tanacetum cinerariifolium]